jgi:hypothetical protein
VVGRWFRALVVVLLAWTANSAMAAFPATSGFEYNMQSMGWRIDPAEACKLYVLSGWTFDSVNTTTGVCYMKNGGGTVSGFSGLQKRGATYCPANATLAGSSCTCASGFEENGTHNACVAIRTESQKFCESMTGYTRKMSGQSGGTAPSAACLVIDPPFPGEDGAGCSMTMGDAITVANPAGGNYWAGIGKYGGGACAPAADPVLGEPRKSLEDDCVNGFAGTVNGVKKCIAAEPDKGISGIKTTERVNTDGSKDVTKETTVCNGANCTTTKEVTNTSTNGTVSVSTSSTTQSLDDKCKWDKTNPVCTKSGTTTGNSTGTGEEEGGDCGGEGEVACKVKVDEEGTPSDGEAPLQGARDKLDEVKGKYDELREKAAGSQDKGMFEQFRSMFLVPPIAACEPITLPEQVASKKIDPCAVVDGVRSVMAYIWALSGLFLCFFMIKRSFE